MNEQANEAERQAIRVEALTEVRDWIDELLQSFITVPSNNTPEWDKAQARMAAHIQRGIDKRIENG